MVQTGIWAPADPTMERRLEAAAVALTERFGLPQGLVLTVIRQPPTATIYAQRKAFCDLLEAFVTTTDPKPKAPKPRK